MQFSCSVLGYLPYFAREYRASAWEGAGQGACLLGRVHGRMLVGMLKRCMTAWEMVEE